MPEILTVPRSLTKTVEVELSQERLVIDSRVMWWDRSGLLQFECRIEGKNLIVTRVDENFNWNGEGWPEDIHFRIYNPAIEGIPDFANSTFYVYHGMEYEQAPVDVEEVSVDPAVKTIRQSAFLHCSNMKRCVMGDSVERIEESAFNGCEAIKSLRLSTALQFIGPWAFANCISIECLFLPQNVRDIQHFAFRRCTGMKMLVLPTSIIIDRVGEHIVYECSALLTDTRVQYHNSHDIQVHHWLKHRYDNLPLFRLCADPDVDSSAVRKFVEERGTEDFCHSDIDLGLTPLHILTQYNIFATNDDIIKCFDANPGALFTPDKEGNTPLKIIWNSAGKLDVIVHCMQKLCIDLCTNQENVRKA